MMKDEQPQPAHTTPALLVKYGCGRYSVSLDCCPQKSKTRNEDTCRGDIEYCRAQHPTLRQDSVYKERPPP